MLDESELRALVSHDVLDREGRPVGNIGTFFNDRQTGRPEWIGVFTGRIRTRHLLVPVRGAEKEGNAVRVPWTKEQVESAPDYGRLEGTISEEMEREAYHHYGLEPAAAGS
jgi:hypothetical protein